MCSATVRRTRNRGPMPVHPHTCRDVRMYFTALPVVDEVAVEAERRDGACEVAANDVSPRSSDLTAYGHARRQVPLKARGDVESLVEARIGPDAGPRGDPPGP